VTAGEPRLCARLRRCIREHAHDDVQRARRGTRPQRRRRERHAAGVRRVEPRDADRRAAFEPEDECAGVEAPIVGEARDVEPQVDRPLRAERLACRRHPQRRQSAGRSALALDGALTLTWPPRSGA
jgi:hypothetical protein